MTLSARASLIGVFFDGFDSGSLSENGWQDAGAVSGVDAGFFDVLHDAGDQDVMAIAERVDVYFDGVFEEAVDRARAGPAKR